MRAIARLRLRIHSLVRRRRVDQELDDEFHYHLERLIERHVAAGLAPNEARDAALREMGPIQQLKEQCRETRGLALIESLRQDLRYAVRTLLKSPGFTAAALLSLAFGIGVNTAIFSLVNGLVLRSLPVIDPQRLVMVSNSNAVSQGTQTWWTYAIWDQIRQRADPFDAACAWWTERLNVGAPGDTQPVDAMWVSGDYFATLGVPALLGRPIGPDDDLREGGQHGAVAVISHELWQRRFAGAVNVIGMTLVVERVPFTIVGVTPSGFFGAEVGRTFDVALPINANRPFAGRRAA